ncbi:MAG TPA: hypothetical protein VIH82_00050 [Acidimicrobiia bacterium]|jgi:hypothetical protein
MAPVLTAHQPLAVRDLRRIMGGIALGVVVAAVFVGVLGLVGEPDTVDRVTIENRGASQLEVGVAGDDHAVLWLAAVEPGSTAVVEDVLDGGATWVVRAEHAGRRAGELRLPRAQLERRGWNVVIPAGWGDATTGT